MIWTIPLMLTFLAAVTSDSARNIYDRIVNFMAPFENQKKNFPDIVKGTWFYGYQGVTKEVLLKTIEVLQQTSGWLNPNTSGADRHIIFTGVADMIGNTMNCDPEGVRKFCAMCFVTANGDESVYKYFSNPDAKYTFIDKVIDSVSDTTTAISENISERADLLVTPSTTKAASINPIIKYAIIGAVGYFVIKKILK